jgi:hypothetical protein
MRRSNPRPQEAVPLVAAVLALLFTATSAVAQLAPTGAHYAGRSSDTGHSPVSSTGGYSTSISLDLPPARNGVTIPLGVTYGKRGVGAAGLGWDVPLSFVRRDASVTRRRPRHDPQGSIKGREQLVVALAGSTTEMVRSGQDWVPRHDGPQLVLRQESAITWRLADGNGQIFTFTALQGLAGSDLWLLTSVSAPGQENRLDIEYELTPHFFTGGSGLAIDLVALRYNTHRWSPPVCQASNR